VDLQYVIVDLQYRVFSSLNWLDSLLFSAGIAGYNMGLQRMSRNYNNIDDHTTGGDYSNDVVARAQYFQRNGY
jgi:hypothetical protein